MNITEEPEVSVIIIHYNDRKWLDGCLSSLLDQDIPADRYEIILADNGSSDGSVSYVKERYSGVRVVELKKNYGFAEGNNKAVSFARGKYLIFLNVDTIVHRRWLSSLVKAITTHKHFKVCQSNILSIANEEFYGKEREALPKRCYYYELTKFGFVDQFSRPFNKEPFETIFVSGASFIVEKKLIGELGYLFNPSFFIYCEDTEFSLRLKIRGYKAGVVPESIVFHSGGFNMAPNRRNLVRALRMSRNKLIAFYECMWLVEYLVYLPLLIAGPSIKVIRRGRRLGMRWWGPLGIAIALIPLNCIAFLLACAGGSEFRNRRRSVLSLRPENNRFWLLREMLQLG